MMKGDTVYAIVRGTAKVRKCKVIAARRSYYGQDLAIRVAGVLHVDRGNGEFAGIDVGTTPEEAKVRCAAWWRSALGQLRQRVDDVRAELQAAEDAVAAHRALKPPFMDETDD